MLMKTIALVSDTRKQGWVIAQPSGGFANQTTVASTKTVGAHVTIAVVELKVVEELEHCRLIPKLPVVGILQKEEAVCCDDVADHVGNTFNSDLRFFSMLFKFFRSPVMPVVVESSQR